VGWTVTNGGSGWNFGNNGWAETSYALCQRYTVVSLLNYVAAEVIDSGSVSMTASETVRKSGSGDYYFINVDVCTTSDCSTILSSWADGTPSSLVYVCYACPQSTKSYTWTALPAGARYVRFKDGGKDSENWGGQYGIQFMGASVVIATCPVPTPEVRVLLARTN
jgi:hypothetical protein